MTFVGWLGGQPLVATRHFDASDDGWDLWSREVAVLGPAGHLPRSSRPVTDGSSVASALDPEDDDGDVAIVADGRLRSVSLPDVAWAQAWRNILGLTPAGEGRGYLLVGATALAIVSADGSVDVTPLPAGYVALAPTSDTDRFLLASVKDASEAGGLTAWTPFGVYLWTRGSTAPTLVGKAVAQVRPSTVGVAWLQSAQGAWLDLSPAGKMHLFAGDARDAIEISPDGSVIASAPGSRRGCDVTSTDPCPVILTMQNGARVTFVGPPTSIALASGGVGMTLPPRPALGLPWRLVTGDQLDLTTTPFQ